MTVEEFSRLPEDQGSVYHELRHGEVVSVTRARLKHQIIQSRLRDYFKGVAPAGSFVETEVPFRPLPEHELRVADVAWVSPERWAVTDPEDYVQGAPDLVIEVLSPSNSLTEISEEEQLCLENGAREFWIVDPKLRLVKISTPDGITRTWRSGQQIPAALFAVTLPVDAVFEGI